MTPRKRKEQVTEGGGNVFADLGFADAPTALAKAELASRISDIIGERELEQQIYSLKRMSDGHQLSVPSGDWEGIKREIGDGS